MAEQNNNLYRSDIPAYLILEDGTVFSGYSLGVSGTTIGEVVFTTAMTGYQETLTDPAYYGQIVTQTFPLIGNYGINDGDKESTRVWLSGYIIREWCYEPSNFRSKSDLGQYLEEQNIVGIYDIDTRALTVKLREKGSMKGAITTEPPRDTTAFLEEIRSYEIKKAVETVSDKESTMFSVEDSIGRVALMDYGYTRNTLRSLTGRGCNVVIMPHDSTLDDLVKYQVDGVFLSDGPGNPADEGKLAEEVGRIMKTGMPVFGVGLGHQLMAIASGGQTEKMKHGHRGANQPVRDVDMDRIFATGQNHGYTVVGDSIPENVGKVTHKNINDDTCEGIEYVGGQCFSVQFHPETDMGFQETGYLFDKFTEKVKARKGDE